MLKRICHMKKTFTLVFLPVITTSTIFATNYYVSALTGCDGFPGTFAQPFVAIRKAADQTTPGDTVLIMNDTSYPVPSFTQSFVTITRRGTPSNYIIYRLSRAYGKMKMATWSQLPGLATDCHRYFYIIFSGIEIERASQSLDDAGEYQKWQNYQNDINR